MIFDYSMSATKLAHYTMIKIVWREERDSLDVLPTDTERK